MATFVLIHGGGDVGWSWHLVEAELRARGHDVVAPDLPCEDETKGLAETADTVVEAIGDRRDVVVVGHSFGGFTASLVADRLPVRALVYLAGMVPAPGEPPADWWDATGYGEAVAARAAEDGGLTGNDDPFVAYYNGVPRPLAEEAMSRARGQSSASYDHPWPLDHQPDVPTRVVLCSDDHFFPPDLQRRVAAERLGVVADEIPGCHCVALSHPTEVAEQLERYLAG
ncbi:alpha/beta hydrolase [Actinotalea ferrariae]|uniref:alpha/beta fold hydrolase n=1 Tax=Actinotalea ferrariae TaxID=1386098 RepID=UPI001C8BB26F|nr:alpha/beta fold hydrolase [Actinotalea ferrariae]MBX9243544.1 alpha/beta hydrolase [Actinotalea ferrariae]